MRRVLLLLGASTCVAVIVASIVFAPASASQYPSGQRLDEPHAKRPIAALDVTLTSATTPTSTSPSTSPASTAVERLNQVMTAIDGDRYRNVLRTYAVASFLNAQAAPAEVVALPATSQPSYETSTQSPSSPAGEGDFLACVRHRESGGDYTIHELTGASQAAGAYQFLPSTWDAISAATGRSDLIGVDPANASPADQDAMAQALYSQQGMAPWGGGCG